MKNDINLLFKRKVKSYSHKNIFVLLLIAVIIVAVAYAGFSLPSAALQAAKTKAVEVQNQLSSSAVDQKDIAEKSELKTKLDKQLAELNALNDAKTDIMKYIDAIERSRSSRIILTLLSTESSTTDSDDDSNESKNTINLVGVSDSDKNIALFCPRLREQNIFDDVFLSTSMISFMGLTQFTIVLTLPSPLDSENIIKELEQKENVTSNTAAAGEEHK